MSSSPRHPVALTFGTVAAGLLAASILSMAVASADEAIVAPDPVTFDPTQVTGHPPYSPEVVTGTEDWSELDLTTNTVVQQDLLKGVDTHTVFGSFTNDDFASSGSYTADLTNFGGGFENEWVDSPGTPGIGMADLLITPFGDFQLFGPADFFTVP
jgi:hypothetical protein